MDSDAAVRWASLTHQPDRDKSDRDINGRGDIQGYSLDQVKLSFGAVALFWFSAVFNNHCCLDSATRRKRGFDLHPSRLSHGNQVIQNCVCHSLVEGSVVTKFLKVQFQGLQFVADLVSDVDNFQRAEVGVPGFWAKRSDLLLEGFVDVVAFWKWVFEGFQCISAWFRHESSSN